MKTFIIGIDFSKRTFDATLLQRENLNAEGSHNVFENNKQGLNAFNKWVKNLVPQEANVVVCAENTGIYSKFISDSLSNQGHTMWLESALQIKRSSGLTRGKNDKKDSRIIAEYAARYIDKCKPYIVDDKEIEALKALLSQRRFLVKQKSAISKRSKELHIAFKNNPLLVVGKKVDTKLISLYSQEIKLIDKQMQSIIMNYPKLKKNYDILTSMKGIGAVNAISFLIYTNNFNRFDFNARKICSYWGVAPFASQSGSSLNGTPHVSHYAETYLKGLLSEAVICAMRFCPTIRSYAQRLKEKGKHPSIVANNCKNKMIHILVAMVKNGTYYDNSK